MAYIRPHRNGAWRAQVSCNGIRETKVLPTREQAQDWAALTVATAKAKMAMQMPLPARVAINDSHLVTAVPRVVLDAMRSVPHQPMHVVLSAIPCTRASGIYFLFINKEVVYVGQSVDALGRIARHRRDGRNFDAFAIIECDPSELDELERKYIRAFVPEGNLTMGG